MCIWGYTVSFYGLITHSFLEVNDITLSGWTTACLSLHLLKKILIASVFWQSRMTPLSTPVCRFWCGSKCWVSTKELTLWIIRSDDVSFCNTLPVWLPERLRRSSPPLALSENSCYSTLSPAFGVMGVWDFGHSGRCLMISPLCFNSPPFLNWR